MSRSVLVGLFIFIFPLIGPFAAESNETRYVFPPNLEMALEPKSLPDSGAVKTFVGALESRVGELRDVQVFFESSPDLLVENSKASFEKLAEGNSKKIEISVKPGKGLPDAGGSWVKMRVVYLPDYAQLTRKISDITLYPDSAERERLREIVERNKKIGSSQTNVVRYFLSETESTPQQGDSR